VLSPKKSTWAVRRQAFTAQAGKTWARERRVAD